MENRDLAWGHHQRHYPQLLGSLQRAAQPLWRREAAWRMARKRTETRESTLSQTRPAHPGQLTATLPPASHALPPRTQAPWEPGDSDTGSSLSGSPQTLARGSDEHPLVTLHDVGCFQPL